MDLKQELQQIIKGEVLNDPETLTTYSRDASLFEIIPKLVVFPKNVEDIKALVKFVNDHIDLKLSISPRSGGTDMTGGPLTTSIVLEFSKYFNHIIEVGDGYAITEPGVYYRDFEKATLKTYQLMPSYPASREICMVGGMVANNSGGEKTLTYGKTEDYVLELKVVLSDGNEYTIKPLSQSGLDKKMAQKDFEGSVYKKIFKLVTQNKKLLAEAKPKVSKNSAGYFLWNVWDGKIFNLCKLLVGSQGTLGIVTEIKFRLIKPKKHSKLLVIFLKDFTNLGGIINHVLEFKPESFESYDDHTLKLATQYFPEVVKFFKVQNIISLGLQFLPEAIMFLTGGMPKLIMMAEFTGDSEAEVDQKAAQAQSSLAQFKLKTRVTKSEEEARKYWVIRRESFNLLRHHLRDKHTAPFIDDLIVRPEFLPEFLPKLDKILNQYPKLVYTLAGHIGDGNFHIIPLMNLKEKDAPEIIKKLSMEVYDLVISFKGSITAEHNDGLIRSPFLKKMYGDKVYELFEDTKRIFDPDDILNPGKKVESKMNYAMAHLEKE